MIAEGGAHRVEFEHQRRKGSTHLLAPTQFRVFPLILPPLERLDDLAFRHVRADGRGDEFVFTIEALQRKFALLSAGGVERVELHRGNGLIGSVLSANGELQGIELSPPAGRPLMSARTRILSR